MYTLNMYKQEFKEETRSLIYTFYSSSNHQIQIHAEIRGPFEKLLHTN